MEFHLYMSLFVYWENVKMYKNLITKRQSSTTPLSCHIIDPHDFTCVNIRDVEVKLVSPKGREQVSHGLWFSTTCNKCFQHVPTDISVKQTASKDDLEPSHAMSVLGRWRLPQDPRARHSSVAPATPFHTKSFLVTSVL